MESQHLELLRRLIHSDVEFTVIGGMAAVFHGSSLVTQDLDVCASLDQQNLTRIILALQGVHPRFRMHPNRPPLPDHAERLKDFRNLCLTTDIGIIDILGEVTGLGGFSEAKAHSQTVELEPGLSCLLLDLDALIAAKRAAGRPKDLLAVAELLLIQERHRTNLNDSE